MRLLPKNLEANLTRIGIKELVLTRNIIVLPRIRFNLVGLKGYLECEGIINTRIEYSILPKGIARELRCVIHEVENL